MKTVLRIYFILFVFCSVSISQQITWQKILNNNYGLFHKTQQINGGNYIAVGSDRIVGHNKIYLVKFNMFGDTIWKRIIGPNQAEEYDGYWVEQTNDKGFIVAGAGPGSISNAYLVKTDSSGIFQWDKSYGGGDLDQAYCVKQTFDKGYILAIRTASFDFTEDIMIVKTDSLGNLEWQKVYNTGVEDNPSELCLLKNYGYAVVGTTFVTGQSGSVYLLRLDLNGDTIWTKKFSGENIAAGSTIDTTYEKGFILGGFTFTQIFSPFKSYAVKTDSTGTLEWQRTFIGKDGEENCKSIRYITNRGYVMAGYSDTPSIALSVSGFIRILNLSGNIISQKYFNPGNDDDYFNSIENTSDGGFIVAGVTTMRQEPSKMYIVKTDSMGYAQSVGIQHNYQSVSSGFELYQNYPNPFNSSTVIKLVIPFKTRVKLSIFDPLGKIVSTLVEGVKDKGNYNFIFNADKYNLSSGIYFIQLVFDVGDNFKLTKSIIYLK